MRYIIAIAMLATQMGCGSQLVELENAYYQCVSAKADGCDQMAEQLDALETTKRRRAEADMLRLTRRCRQGNVRCYDLR